MTNGVCVFEGKIVGELPNGNFTVSNGRIAIEAGIDYSLCGQLRIGDKVIVVYGGFATDIGRITGKKQGMLQRILQRIEKR